MSTYLAGHGALAGYEAARWRVDSTVSIYLVPCPGCAFEPFSIGNLCAKRFLQVLHVLQSTLYPHRLQQPLFKYLHSEFFRNPKTTQYPGVILGPNPPPLPPLSPSTPRKHPTRPLVPPTTKNPPTYHSSIPFQLPAPTHQAKDRHPPSALNSIRPAHESAPKRPSAHRLRLRLPTTRCSGVALLSGTGLPWRGAQSMGGLGGRRHVGVGGHPGQPCENCPQVGRYKLWAAISWVGGASYIHSPVCR